MQYTFRTETLRYDEDVTVRASIIELELDAYGRTEDEAIANLNDLFRVELEHRREIGRPLPAPSVITGLINACAISVDVRERMEPAGEIISAPVRPSTFTVGGVHLALA